MTIHLELGLEEGTFKIPYQTIDEMLGDPVLRRLFERQQVIKIEIWDTRRRISAVPSHDLTWRRFHDTVLSNAMALLRDQYDAPGFDPGRKDWRTR